MIGNYQLLPNVVRIVYSIPTSSAQIERDFGVSGMMLTSQRASMSGANVDMCSFINRNDEYIHINQCEAIGNDEDMSTILPSNISTSFDSREVQVEEILAAQFSETL